MTGTSSAPAPPPVRVGVLASAVGGALGALVRWSLSTGLAPAPGHFPWVTFAINLTGSGLLALLPVFAVVRARPWLAILLGTGVLGGYTTMSAASVDTFTLLDTGHVALGAAYGLGTLGGALLVVLLVDRFVAPAWRVWVLKEGGDE